MSAKIVIVCGLGFGDEGKGTVVDALAYRHRGLTSVIRYNGGPQAGHNVVTPEGVWHCFAQFGSASLVPGSATLLSRHMLVAPDNLLAERDVLAGKRKAAPRLAIDPECLVITPMQKIVGRMRELARGAGRFGSCGQGVGETVRDGEAGLALKVWDLFDRKSGRNKMLRLLDAKRSEALVLSRSSDSSELAAAYDHFLGNSDVDEIWRRYRSILGSSWVSLRPVDEQIVPAARSGRLIVFEGAQGALLDRTRGSVPYVTKSDTTCSNALDLLSEAGWKGYPRKLGIMRAYGHRHGPGPFPTEDERLLSALDDPLNPENAWQGKFRVGALDLPALRYGLAMNSGVEALAVTGLDRLSGLKTIPVCVAHQGADAGPFAGRPEMIELPGWDQDISGAPYFGELPGNAQALIRFLESQDGLGRPVDIVSVGPRSDQKLFLY